MATPFGYTLAHNPCKTWDAGPRPHDSQSCGRLNRPILVTWGVCRPLYWKRQSGLPIRHVPRVRWPRGLPLTDLPRQGAMCPMPRYTIHGDAYDGFHLSPLDERPSRAERRFIELTEDEFAEWQRIDAAYDDWQQWINRASEDEANVIPPMAGAAEYLESMYGSATAPDGSLAPGAHLVLTSMNREPGAGSVVRDSLGRLWYARTAQGGIQYWLYENHLDSDPESWTKVAGNYGPVEVVKLCGWRGN